VGAFDARIPVWEEAQVKYHPGLVCGLTLIPIIWATDSARWVV